MTFMEIEPSEYERLRSWLGYMFPKLFPQDRPSPDTDPVAVLDRLAAGSPAKARSGLNMAIGDIIEFTAGWSAADVSSCDQELSRMGLPTLSEMQARFSRLVQRVVHRGWIRSDEEFYAIRNAVEWAGAGASTLSQLLDASESRA